MFFDKKYKLPKKNPTMLTDRMKEHRVNNIHETTSPSDNGFTPVLIIIM
jgi:hypothetical protein